MQHVFVLKMKLVMVTRPQAHTCNFKKKAGPGDDSISDVYVCISIK